jgi:hypothetical protein
MERVDNGIKWVYFKDIFKHDVEAVLPVYLDEKGNPVVEPARPQDYKLTETSELLISPQRKDIHAGDVLRVINTGEYYEIVEVMNDAHTRFLTKELK